MRTILITGASRGIGKTTARFFQQKGWNVIATMRSPGKEEELTRLDNVLVTRLDVQDAASIASAFDAGIARFGRIDVLLNTAGYGSFGVLEATPVEKIRRQCRFRSGRFTTVRSSRWRVSPKRSASSWRPSA